MEVSVTRLTSANTGALVKLFTRISTDPVVVNFHPHPFTREEAHKIANWSGRDIYLGLFADGAQWGYGMLRGWDEHYDVPSLGIYLAPEARGRGLSRILMEALHDYARRAGASRIRLKVYPDNIVAVRLYERLGYRFQDVEAGQMVGYLQF